MIPPDETARVYYPANHGGAMWQPPAYSPLTHYFYTMAINEPHIYKVKASKPWVPGTPEVGQQFGNAVPTEAERKALAVPDDSAIRVTFQPSTSTPARSPGSISAII